METEPTSIPRDVAASVDDEGYPIGLLETPFGKFQYRVHYDDAYFYNEDGTLAINGVSYKTNFHLQYGKNEKCHSACIEGWHFCQGSYRLDLRRTDWLSSNKHYSDAAYDKIRNQLIPFLCKWITANPELLKAGQRATLKLWIERLETEASDLQQQAEQKDSNATKIMNALSDFDCGIRLNFNELKDLL